jgi:hypothetical protein
VIERERSDEMDFSRGVFRSSARDRAAALREVFKGGQQISIKE